MAAVIKGESKRYTVKLQGHVEGYVKCESWSDFIQQVVIHPKWNPKFPTHQETEIKLFRATNIDGGDLRRDRNAQERTRALADSDAYVHSLEEWNRGGQKGPMPRGVEEILVLHEVLEVEEITKEEILKMEAWRSWRSQSF